MFLEKQYQLGDEVNAAFTVVIDGILLKSLKDHLSSSPDLGDRVKSCVSPQDLIKLLPLQLFNPCLQQVRDGHQIQRSLQDVEYSVTHHNARERC